MSYPKLFAVAIVSVCMFVPTNFANAKHPKGKQSHKNSHHANHKRDGHHDKHHKKRHVRHHEELHDGHNVHHDRQRRHHEEHRERHEDHHADDHANHHGADDHHRDDHHRDGDRFHEDNRPLETQRLNEERKLQHRLNQAENLRQISERNGNPRFAETADRIEQRAREDYEQRLQHIDQHESVGPTRNGFAEQEPSSIRQPDQVRTSSTAQPPGRSLSEFSDGFQRRLFSEQRELRQRLDTADRLRQLGEYNGDPQLLETANRIEDAAFERFDRRTQRWGEPLTLDQQSLVREPNRMVSQGINDIENAILEQPARRLWQEVRRFINR